MIEEPFRWVEAIQSRREYIGHQLSGGSPIVALSGREGLLLLTLSHERQKLFEIYDRIAMGGLGHPGDIERLRMTAIEVTSAEGFNRSSLDVSLRRLVSYSLSPALKAAFEQIYGPPYLARLLFAEMGRTPENDLFVRLNYDGSFHTNGRPGRNEPFAILAGDERTEKAMEAHLCDEDLAEASPEQLYEIALDTWVIGKLAREHAEGTPPEPTRKELDAARADALSESVVEAAFMDRNSRASVTFHPIPDRLEGGITQVTAPAEAEAEA